MDRRKAIGYFLTRTLSKITTKMTSLISMNEKEVPIPPWVPKAGVTPSNHFIVAMNILESHSNDTKNHHHFLSEEEKQSIMLENALFQGFW